MPLPLPKLTILVSSMLFCCYVIISSSILLRGYLLYRFLEVALFAVLGLLLFLENVDKSGNLTVARENSEGSQRRGREKSCDLSCRRKLNFHSSYSCDYFTCLFISSNAVCFLFVEC